jgi:bifunctional UDP-N-acetylglucosamine pyrophosphorylase / glucosamine-1-phosphate N-acetyltransferase
VIEPGVQLLSNTRIGARCTIQTGSVLHDVRVDDDVTVGAHCGATASRLHAKSTIGPFSRLRPGADIRSGAHIGNFVEVKKSVVHEGAKAMHLTYLGDASVGRGSNIGAGTITCNYDGVAKYQTSIGERVFIGSDTALVAPIRVGNGAYVAAGSTLTENVPAEALAVARGRQVNKPDWARKRRLEVKREEKNSRRSKRKPRRKAAKPRAKTKHRVRSRTRKRR